MWPYVLGLDALALAVCAYSLTGLTLRDVSWGFLVAAVYAWVELHPLAIRDEGDLSMGLSVQIAALLFVGLEATLLGLIIGEFAYSLIRGRPAIKVCFNVGQILISAATAHFMFKTVGGDIQNLTGHSFALALTYMIVNSVLVSWILSLAQRQPFWRSVVALNRDTLPYQTIMGVSGLAFGGLLLSYGWLGLVMVAVLTLSLRSVLTQASFNLRSMKVRFVQTVRVLMTALEYRDPYTYGHSSRVATWARKIALEMGLPVDEVDRIELGGLVHDVGKVGVPDLVLNKPGKLSQEEFEQIKAHTLIGERIILGMDGMEHVAAMARQHHLYYDGDGRGYPDQTPGRDTYIGSRILGVADAWDAMTSDRPYRKALSVDRAVAQVVANRGIQFDPDVVDAFLRVLANEGLLSPNQATAPAPDGRKAGHAVHPQAS